MASLHPLIAGLRAPFALLLFLIAGLSAIAQRTDTVRQRDLMDLLPRLGSQGKTHPVADAKAVSYSFGPIIEYSPATQLTLGVAVAGSFVSSTRVPTKRSSLLMAIKYTQRKQFLLPVQTYYASAGNRWLWLGDWRYLYFPQDSYGIGGWSSASNRYIIANKTIRFYQFGYRQWKKDFYFGAGYQLDRHWQIRQEQVPTGQVTDFTRYGFASESTSSGVAIGLLFDSRASPIVPEAGSAYGNIVFTGFPRWLGSSSSWELLTIDLRRYLPIGRRNVLAFWVFAQLTVNGNPPYLDLPGTATDEYNNTGRGYEPFRFVGKQFVCAESEFRFGITRDGLLGGVLFVNAESVTERLSRRFETILPGYGLGLRIKFNKGSGTNTCIDYGRGRRQSSGFFGNLGEVF